MVDGRQLFYTSTAAIEKKTLLAAGAFPKEPGGRGGDVATWLKVVSHSRGVAVARCVGAIYYRNSVSMVSRTTYDEGRLISNTVKKLLYE